MLDYILSIRVLLATVVGREFLSRKLEGTVIPYNEFNCFTLQTVLMLAHSVNTTFRN